MAEEIVTSTAAQLASEATVSACDLLKQHISYVFKYQSYINDLKKLVEELRNKKETVEKPVELAERQGGEIYKAVKKWLSDVDEFTERVAKAIIEDEDKANKGSCLKLKSCPNLIQRYKLGKEAVKAAVSGADLLGKGNFRSVSYRPALQRTESMYVRGYKAFDSREQVLQEILDTLKDVNVNMVGVHGMGGVGKTTLVKKVAWQVKEDKLFHEVAIAEVTQTPDYKKIQEKLASDLGLEFCQESEYQRASQLRSRIKKEKSLLIILDNIWTKLDLDAIGIPFGDAEKGGKDDLFWDAEKGGKDDLFWDAEKERKDDKIRPCTILLTSRNRDVLSKDMKTQKNIFVSPLSEDDAWNLFRKIVGDSVESSDFHPLADEFVTKCAGLPIAISTIANTLKNESLHFWKDALARLKRSNPRHIPDMEESVYSTIELSYNFLKIEEAKSLFLLCALADAGSSMSTGDLLKYSMGLNLFGDVYTLEEGRDRLHSLIDYLKASCLLLDDDNDHAVKMHDIIHDVAVSIASTEKFMFNIQNVICLKEVLGEKIPKHSTAISLPYRDIYDKLPQRLEFPKLKLFFLLMKNHSLQIPDVFFEEMKELRVLNLTRFQFFSLPSSFSCLKNLKTLCLDNCLLEDLTILGELSKLEILSFSGSHIKQLPTEIGRLTWLKLLDLSNCINLKYIAPHVLSCLSRLEELYMGNCFVQWEVEGVDNQGRRNASLEELKQLLNITALHLHVQDARGMPQDFFFKKLKSYHLFVGDKWKWSDKYYSSTSRTFKLKISDNVYLGQGIKSLLEMTEDLFLEEMNGVRCVVYELNVDGFPHLKHLHVKDSLDILYIINSVAWKVAFPKLESLILCNLIKLEKICHGQLNAGSFSKLKIIKIEKCDRLEYLFSSFMVKNLMQLQEIEVTDCKNLKELFGEENDYHGDEIEMNDKIEFNQLCSLTLQRLHKFNKIDSNLAVVFPRLENLQLCSINIDNTWLDRSLSIFSYSQCLKSLSIEECHGLNYLFSSAMVKSLNELQKLVISNCKSMEVIVNSKGIQGEEKIIDMSFPKLLYMKLKFLPELTSFGIGKLIEFPSLKELHIERCSNLKTFLCKSSHPDTVREEGEVNLENYFMNINPLLDEKVAFPSLEEMVLLDLDNLQLIWHNQKLHGKSFCKLKVVRVESCEKLLTIVSSNTQGNLSFRNLKRLTVRDCRSMNSLFPVSTATGLVQLEHLEIRFCGLEKIVSEEEVMGAPTFLFPQLKSIYLIYLKELKYFYPRWNTIEWPMLSTLEMSDCKKIKVHDFEFSSFQERDEERQPPIFYLEKVLPNLEMLRLEGDDFGLAFLCSNLAERLGKLKHLRLSDFDDESGSSLVNFLQKLNCLESLDIIFNRSKELFPFKQGHIWKQDFRGDSFLQNLQKLSVFGCDCLTISMPSSTSFKNLKNLSVHWCNGLDKALTCEAAKTLVNITTLVIKKCKLLTGVVASEGDQEEEIVFGQLKTLELSCLSSLTSFCSANYSFKFPCLEQVVVSQCPKLKIFSQGALSTPLLKKIQLTEEYNHQEFFWEDDLNSTIQQIFTKMVGYRNFEHLTLSEFPNIKERIWNGQLPNNFFENLKSLVVDTFLDISTGISSNVLCCFKNLELLKVKSCESLEQVFDLEESHQEISGLQKLKSLKIDNCNSLRSIFTPAILLGLVQLQEVKVKNCALIEEIIKKEEKKDGVSDKIIIPKLNSVMLESLPSLTSFYSGRNILECPPLETIIIKDCQKVQMKEFNIHLAAFFTEKVDIPALGSCSCFQNLTILHIGGFDHLKYLFPPSMLKSFFKLKELEISNCTFMERVIDEDDGRTRTILFPKLCWLELRDLPRLITFYNSTASFVEMSSLLGLWINNCPGIQTFISSSIYGDMTASSKELEGLTAKEDSTHMVSLFDKKVRLPSLKILEITHANHLVKLWDNQVSLDSFGKLIRVTVGFCKRLVSVFPANMLGSHQKLEFLEVQNCDSVEEIFEVLEKSSVMVEENFAKEETIPRFVFSKLTWLYLKMLPSLKSFYPEKHISEWPDLEVLKVHGCNNVKIIASESLSIPGSDGESQQTLFFVYKDAFPSLEELELCEMPRLLHLWRGNFQPCNAFQNLKTLKVSECGSLENSCFSMLSLQNLRTLQVSKCDGLRYLLTPSKAKTLNRLKRMNVSECKLMVEIMTHLGDEVVENSIVFGKLDCLELHCLPSLKSFCGGHYSLEFPFLEKVIVRKCLEMETFCHGVLSTPSLQRLQLTDGGEDAVEECWEGNLNSTIQYLFKNMNVRYSKED
ncbi:uncharacterized protein LOC123218538 isoform X3 [Mangifera indica]|uniref:uncharacterized protein LOC123218538 isoform X3 n=1 Tax=Mangifera indica TaxID=29780 RepID=UPI001CFBBF01|nr:uncharacterized protein LOC123218538 isoform X3 [Mangifera indica]